MLAYTVVLTPDDNGTLLVTCPDLPEVTTFGVDEADALLRAWDAIEEALAARIAAGEDVPAPSRGQPAVELPPLAGAKVELWRALRERGIRQSELARRLNVGAAAVDRLLDLNHPTRLEELERAARALGRRVAISLPRVPEGFAGEADLVER